MTHISYSYTTRSNPSNTQLNLILARNVRLLRKDQQLKSSTLAFISGIGRPLLSRIEHGKADVRLSYVHKLADALCVDPLVLLVPFPAEFEKTLRQ